MLMKKVGNKFHRYVLTGNGLVNIDLSKDEDALAATPLETNAPAKVRSLAQAVKGALAPEPVEKTKEDILSEINKRFSQFTSGETKPTLRNKHFRLK